MNLYSVKIALPAPAARFIFSGGGTVFPDLGEAGPAILTIKQADQGGHDRTPLFTNGPIMLLDSLRPPSRDRQNGFFTGLFGFFGASPRNQFTRP
jgi:hypothetical protein